MAISSSMITSNTSSIDRLIGRPISRLLVNLIDRLIGIPLTSPINSLLIKQANIF